MSATTLWISIAVDGRYVASADGRRRTDDEDDAYLFSSKRAAEEFGEASPIECDD